MNASKTAKQNMDKWITLLRVLYRRDSVQS